MRTVWDISNNKARKELAYGKHPTQKPIKIIKRMIRLSSRVGDVMMTPFAGAGSECVAAKECQRHYLGFETDKQYINIAEERLKNADIESNEEKIDNPNELTEEAMSKKKAKKNINNKTDDNQLSIFDMEINIEKKDEIK